MKTITLNTPLDESAIDSLRAGDKVLLNGSLLVARDQAHMRLIEMIKKGEPLPVDLQGQAVYYAGPSPTKPGEVIGSIGPTTASRMDTVSEPLFKQGLKMTIGKGVRSDGFKAMVKQYKVPYLVAMGGGGAVMQESIIEAETVAFEDLGPEAIYRLIVRDMPLYVAYDVHEGDIYQRN